MLNYKDLHWKDTKKEQVMARGQVKEWCSGEFSLNNLLLHKSGKVEGEPFDQ